MFVGHLAAALGAKKLAPDVPLSATVAASFGIDLAWPVFLLLGLETVRIAPADTAFTSLAFESYPWTHSLLLVLAWGSLATAVGKALLGAWRPGLLLGALVVSHWVLDWVTHRPDLPLWPGGPLVGLGLWNSIPGTIAVEGLFFLGAIVVYRSVSKPTDGVGRWALTALLLLTGLTWVSQPWAPPAPGAAAVAVSALVLWLLVPWAHWAERHREVTPQA